MNISDKEIPAALNAQPTRAIRQQFAKMAGWPRWVLCIAGLQTAANPHLHRQNSLQANGVTSIRFARLQKRKKFLVTDVLTEAGVQSSVEVRQQIATCEMQSIARAQGRCRHTALTRRGGRYGVGNKDGRPRRDSLVKRGFQAFDHHE